MKLTFFTCVIFAVVVVSVKTEEKYTTKYDNINIDEIINNDRLLRSYVDCLLGTKPCTKDGEELKKVLKEALETKCAKCSEAQIEAAKKIGIHLIKNKRPWFDELVEAFDPDHTKLDQYKEDLKAEGVEL
ncbi:ejaculatory bulb-specific protein 3-like [Diorhabda carinulata]|uniref:ejaculatory bulb-specific protein 3-like n=1 Tax=Diorhabda sublineata TaxID=1163346 RepID=UPI0024E11645|nr:ejaculatory bulb-specific protein 3-like [Diorhabda sublineata]XP_057656968.1 ejaculatory bulb-specific protein 3-like [Diorhabda carinulata]